MPGPPAPSGPQLSTKYYRNSVTLTWTDPTVPGYPCDTTNLFNTTIYAGLTNPPTTIVGVSQLLLSFLDLTRKSILTLIPLNHAFQTSVTNTFVFSGFPLGLVYWRMTAKNQQVQGTTYSAVWYFYTCPGATHTTETMTPNDGMTDSTPTGTKTLTLSWSFLNWSPVPCGDDIKTETTFSVFLSNDLSQLNQSLVQSGIPWTTPQKEVTVGVGTWYWKVVPTLQGTDLAASVSSFTIRGCGDGWVNVTSEECGSSSLLLFHIPSLLHERKQRTRWGGTLHELQVRPSFHIRFTPEFRVHRL